MTYMRSSLSLLILGCAFLFSFNGEEPRIGDVIDSLHGVKVYYNGNIENVFGRNLTKEGYNLGLKYQCVEFVKRYYFENEQHIMPYSYGHAKDFFNNKLGNDWRVYNGDRGLYQYKNGNFSKPEVGDIIVFNRDKYNPFGHIGIISFVGDYSVEMIQQNYGRDTRSTFRMSVLNSKYYIANDKVKGWLRKS